MIDRSNWTAIDEGYIYEVEANRFLRGMVRGLVGTMLHVGRGKINLEEFESIIRSGDCTRADFSVPAQGLFLRKIRYPEGMLKGMGT